MIDKKDINVKLNLLKGFACMGVVFIHITFPGLFGQIVLYVAEYAVPIFFMIAGYYAFGKAEKILMHRLGKIFKIFAIAYALFFLYSFSTAAMRHEGALWLYNNFNWITPI